MSIKGYNFDLTALENVTLGGKKISVGEAYEVAGQIMHLHETGKITPNFTAPSFTVGLGNTYHQAFTATLAGHAVQLPDWPPDMKWVFERNSQELLRVYGDTPEDWRRSGTIVCPTGAHQLSAKWIVLPIIDTEPITI